MRLRTAFFVAATLLASAAQAQTIDTQLKDIEGKVFAQGPNGEPAAPASSIVLDDAEVQKVKAMNATVALVMPHSGNDWADAQVAGLREEFGKLGIKIVAVTDAQFKADKQASDIETVLALKPNLIVSVPVDRVAMASAFQRAVAQGVKIVLMENVPEGFKAGKDYISLVSADNTGNGFATGLLMAKHLNGKGKIGIIFHAADFLVTRQRLEGFKAALKAFPDIQIVAEQGVGGPDFSSEAERVASAMLTAHHDIDGIWAVWDIPAEGVVAAARNAGADKLIVTTCDLGKNVAIDMAQGDYVQGIGSQRPFDQGVTEAKLAAYGLLGKSAPAYVALPSLPVERDNLKAAWKSVYHVDLPSEISALIQ